MFEVVEKHKEVTVTEVEKVAMFICDMCGEGAEVCRPDGPFLKDGNIGLFYNDEPWSRMVSSHKGERHLCPSCAEKVREFIDGGHLKAGALQMAKESAELFKAEKEKLEKERDEASPILGKPRNPKPTSYVEACADLKPLRAQRCLVRWGSTGRWSAALFEGYKHSKNVFRAAGGDEDGLYSQCLPYEFYAHLLGTTDSPWGE